MQIVSVFEKVRATASCRAERGAEPPEQSEQCAKEHAKRGHLLVVIERVPVGARVSPKLLVF